MAKKFNGNFGNLVQAYDKARPSYPKYLLDYIFDHLDIKNPTILDLGCGTGISTRLLAKRTKKKVFGTDIDPEMIAMAKSHKTKNVVYKVANSNKLPFKDNSFDLVTAFTAFHWFADAKTLKEIKRVLKPNGVLGIAGIKIKGTAGSILKKYLIHNLKMTFPESGGKREEFIPALKRAKMKNILSKKMPVKDYYSLEKYVLYAQSNSRWNFVPQGGQEAAREYLRTQYKKKLRNGKILETRDVQILLSWK